MIFEYLDPSANTCCNDQGEQKCEVGRGAFLKVWTRAPFLREKVCLTRFGLGGRQRSRV